MTPVGEGGALCDRTSNDIEECLIKRVGQLCNISKGTAFLHQGVTCCKQRVTPCKYSLL